ncbi:hypothetical protein Plhal703r1_c33g0126631 [Plasmopara halstedii]
MSDFGHIWCVGSAVKKGNINDRVTSHKTREASMTFFRACSATHCDCTAKLHRMSRHSWQCITICSDGISQYLHDA